MSPEVEPLGESEAEQLVSQHLAKAPLPQWDPGPSLPKADLPAREPFPPPPLWQAGPIGDAPLEGRALELAAQGREDFANGNFQAAATRLLDASRLQPTWEVQYDAGLSLLAAGDSQLAAQKLVAAEERLLVLANSDTPAFHAAQVATPYAAGIAFLEFDCIDAIFRLRRAVRPLQDYADAAGTPVYNRQLPFRVREAEVDSPTAWATLARAYDGCEGKFPRDFESRYERQQDFAAEYKRADIPEVREGPFAGSLADCVAAGKETISSRCWAYSNLNKAAWGARSYFPQSDEAPVGRGLDRTLLPSLARLAYEIAWHAAGTEKDRQQAGTYLVYAARIDRQAKVPGFADRIAELGRYIAPITKNYSLLAEPWRRRDLNTLTFDANMKPEEIKGAAWALQERWGGHLRDGDPKLMMEEIDSQISRAGPHGASLQSWKAEVQEKLRETLATAMLTERTNGNLPAALAIRDLAAPWLGSGWSAQAFRAWLTWKVWLRWAFLLLVWLLATAAVWFFHRLVVFPYLVYSTDYYRLEHQRR
ncbi:MAG TPA: hypothetical protein VKM72_08595, partial [Thermoanaerobaculia bacterium]|nr:hypothetical protein [Thermoanaerobaculia bacterium]